MHSTKLKVRAGGDAVAQRQLGGDAKAIHNQCREDSRRNDSNDNSRSFAKYRGLPGTSRCQNPAPAPSSEKGIGDITRAEGFNRAYVTRFLCLAFLEPEITKAILEGRQPAELTAKRLINSALNSPLLWPDQIDIFRS
jgi:hypothetical protein